MKITSRFWLLVVILFSFTPAFAQTDCPDAIIVCGDANYSGLDATGVGIQEINPSNACSSQEHNSLWLKIQIKDGGTLGFILSPESNDLVVDFDFWMYGPNVTCGALGTAIRCSTTNPGAAGLTFNHTGMNATETDSAEGPGPHGNAYVQWLDVADDDIYYLIIDRPHGQANFSIEWTGTATFHNIPQFLNPDNVALEIIKCDDDGIKDGRTDFDLTQFETMFIGAQTDVEITYHLDSNGMTTGEGAMQDPHAYFNAASPQTIYMRMTNPVTGCYSTETLTILTDIAIEPGLPQDLALCDRDDDNGIRYFDLTENDNLIRNGNANTSVTYHASQEEAENKTGALPFIYSNQDPYAPQTIWARLETTSGCYRYGIISFTITVHPRPELLHTDDFPEGIPLEVFDCDDDGISDQSTVFDLTVYETMLTGTQTGVAITYHTQSSGAETGDDPIINPLSYANTSNPQILYIRMANATTGCYVFETLTLNVDDFLPTGIPDDLELCDTDGDGFGEFDLALNNESVSNGNPDIAVTYYNSPEDAENKENPLPTLYQNQYSYSIETIWARAETTQGCHRYGITSFNIKIYPEPQMMRSPDFPASMPLEITACDDDGTNDGFTAFDLTTFEAMLIGSQSGVAITYYSDYNNALNGTDDIDDPESYVNTSSPQTIFLRMTYTATGCFVTETLSIRTDILFNAGIPEPLSLCDDNGDGFRMFNLAENDEALSNGLPGTAVTYYASAQDAEDKASPLPVPYQNQEAYMPEIIWARVETTSGCYRYGIASFAIAVNVIPQMMRDSQHPAGTQLTINACDDDGIHDGTVATDLTQFEEMLIGNQSGVAISYHTDPADLENGDDPVLVPTAFTNTANPQTIYLRMANSATGCFTTETLVLELDYILPIGEPEPLILCDTEGDGIQNFDLRENDDLIKDGNFNSAVTYYASQGDAENRTNPLPRIYSNQHPYLTQTIWARLENITGCYGYGITSFTIGVLPVSEINYTIDVTDFTPYDNSIAVIMDNSAEYEFSLDGRTFTGATFFDRLPPGVYTLYIRSKDGCSSITEQIPILNYPKFFTPNGDGINEVWNVAFIHFFPNAIVNIFDRYGKLIKSYRGKELGWDGTYNGERLPSTDYWFEIDFPSGRKIKGHFAMVR
ncbi:T9SS type B sorting domain-containing protein [uncultured Flavobacterium sp.]|uniref:T9SS type B sorting domain-containing protein n=1 Tax=uncultured Flavobacterium sp. TaxID=165435 RepID=UPI0026002C53|nr:T9SS type B sorting domain-containing protein [uncultured Flavobacterium sp.]